MRTVTKEAYEGDIVSRLRNWRGLHLAHGGELFEEAADEIERLQKLVALWEECADNTVRTFGNCIRPEYQQKLRKAASGFCWIGVTDRLPKDGEEVLWWTPEPHGHGRFLLAKRDGYSLDWGGDLNTPLNRYTHWRHLPDPVS